MTLINIPPFILLHHFPHTLREPASTEPSESLLSGNARDFDSDILAVKLDGFTRTFRKEVVDLFSNSKNLMEKKYQDQYVKRSNELQQLNTQLSSKYKSLQHTTGLAIKLLQHSKHKLKLRGMVCRVYYAWKEVARQGRLLKLGIAVAGRRQSSGDRRSLRRAFSIWRGATISHKREKLHEEAEAKLQIEKQRIWREANAQNRAMAEKLLEMEMVVEREKATKRQFEQDLAAVFQKSFSSTTTNNNSTAGSSNLKMPQCVM
jgi:hypothetical protein